MFKIFSLTCLIGVISTAHAASFDCKKAKAPVEKTICNTPKLSQQDEEMGKMYQSLANLLSSEQSKHVRRTQQLWIGRRNQSCSAEDVNCLSTLYTERLQALSFRGHEAYLNAPSAKVAGIYKAEQNMELVVEAESYDNIIIYIDGVEPTQGRWTCDFVGRGVFKNNAVSANAIGDAPDPNNRVNVTFPKKGRATVSTHNDGQNAYCGLGGSLDGDYMLTR